MVQRVVAAGDSGAQELGMVRTVVAAEDPGAQELGWFRQWQQQGIQELRNWDG